MCIRDRHQTVRNAALPLDEDPLHVPHDGLDEGIRLVLSASGKPLLRPAPSGRPTLDMASPGLGRLQHATASQPHGIPSAPDEHEAEGVGAEPFAAGSAAVPPDGGDGVSGLDRGLRVFEEAMAQPAVEALRSDFAAACRHGDLRG